MKILTGCCVALLGFFLLLQACTNASSRTAQEQVILPPALRNPHLRSLLAEYDRFFSDSMTGSQTPGAALVIVKDSTVIFQRGYGLKAAGTKDSVGVNTVFRIGSLSKGFAGVLAAVLVEEGKLKWDDRVVQYIPEFALSSPGQTREVQLHHLLSHTTGLPYHAYTNLIEAGHNVRSIAARFAGLPLHGKPGEIYSYQNAAFSLIGEAMTVSTGRSYPELLRRKVFQPAGMVDASADWTGINRCSDKALPHRGCAVDSITHRFYNAAPAGGINASIADMGQWLLVLLGYKPDVVSPETLKPVFTPVIRTHRERRPFLPGGNPADAWYALGWRVLTNGTDTLIYHGGSVNDYRSEIAFSPRDGIGICVLFNAHTPLANNCIPAFWERYYAYRDSIAHWTPALVE